jgi:hypothetical protein
VRAGLVVLDGQKQLAAGASAWDLVELADPLDGITGVQRTRGAERLGEKRCATGM